jgi:hypothetical protein
MLLIQDKAIEHEIQFDLEQYEAIEGICILIN